MTTQTNDELPTIFYHGTRADLRVGDFIVVGNPSNFGSGEPLSWVYLTGTLEAAIWGAELAQSAGRERIYIVEPTGPIIDDPNLTNRRFPGNPTKSYRSRDPLRIVGEITEWTGHSPEQLREMRTHVQTMREQGGGIID